jgi:hypothetical protein
MTFLGCGFVMTVKFQKRRGIKAWLLTYDNSSACAFQIIAHLQKKEGVTFKIRAACAAASEN